MKVSAGDEPVMKLSTSVSTASHKCTHECLSDALSYCPIMPFPISQPPVRHRTCPPGRNALDVYERGGQPDDVPKGAKYLGCFGDIYNDRALSLRMTTSDKMDYDVSTPSVFYL